MELNNKRMIRGGKVKKSKKAKFYRRRVLAVVLIIGGILGLFYWHTRNKLQVVTVVSEIGDYDYYLESNATRIYKKYYKELEKELEDHKIDEENYASLVAQLFVIDYYTLNNKITNKNIGGTQFIHSELKNRFIEESSNTVYKYVKNNLYGNRKQKLPEVNDVKISSIQEINYHKNDYQDSRAYQVVVKVGYVKDYDYPEEVNITLIHEENRLVIVEIN